MTTPSESRVDVLERMDHRELAVFAYNMATRAHEAIANEVERQQVKNQQRYEDSIDEVALAVHENSTFNGTLIVNSNG